MEIRKFAMLGINPQDDVIFSKWIMAIYLANEKTALEIKELFESHGYDLRIVSGSFFKMFTKNEKEVADLALLLEEIDKLDYKISEDVSLKSVFQKSLRYGTFTKSFVEKVKYCINNGLPYLYEDNTFITELYDNERFGAYSTKVPVQESKLGNESFTTSYNSDEQALNDDIKPAKLEDPEDVSVRQEIIRNLTNIMTQNQNDSTLNFLIENIIANLNDVIVEDNKQYRIFGTRHLVENALQGVNITPELQYELDDKVLSAFTDLATEKERRV